MMSCGSLGLLFIERTGNGQVGSGGFVSLFIGCSVV